MKPGTVNRIHDLERWPRVRLSLKLKKIRHLIYQTFNCMLVVQGFLEPYLHSVIASDHLLGSTGKRLMETCFLHFSEHMDDC